MLISKRNLLRNVFVFLGIFCPQKNKRIYIICLEDCFAFGITCMFRCWARNVFLCGGRRGGDIFFPPNTWATVGLGLWYLPLLHAGWTPPLEKPAGRGLCGSSWAEGHWIMVPWWWWHWRGIYPNHCKSTSPWLQIVVTCSDYDMFVFIYYWWLPKHTGKIIITFPWDLYDPSWTPLWTSVAAGAYFWLWIYCIRFKPY